MSDEQRRHRNDADHSRWTIVLIEACGAGRFVEQLGAHLLQKGLAENLLLIGAGERTGSGHLAVARGVLTTVIGSFTDNDTEIRLTDLADRIERRLPFGRVQPLAVGRCVLRRGLATVTAPLDVYAELHRVLAALPAQERAHFARKGMGADFGELAWHFVGRGRELTQIAQWLATTSDGMLIVTGRAGTGKSAVLGNLLIRSRPQVRQLLTRAGLLTDLPPDAFTDQLPSFDVTLHLTGVTVSDVVMSVRDSVGLPPLDLAPQSGAQLTTEQLNSGLVAAMRDTRTPTVLLADALDEAQQPLAVASLLRDLAALTGIRVVVGTRASTREGPDFPQTDDTDLLNTLDPRGMAQWIVIRRDGDTLGQYLRQRLAAVLETPTDRPVVEAAVGHLVRQPGFVMLTDGYR